ncbi:MAG: enoyl-CoA hydratase/isomerase family protein [Pseudomonadales bacterium]
MQRLLLEKDSGIWTVRFHNPPHHYMDQHTATAFEAVLDEVQSSNEVRVVILTGSEPGMFIRHYDVGELLQLGKDLAEQGAQFSIDKPSPEADIHRCYRRMEELPVPFIAAVNGSAMGGGFEIALASDIRLVQDGEFDLGLPEVNIGILPGAGGTQRLPRIIGQGRALQMMLLGETISPRQAADYGIAMECVAGDVQQRAMEIAQRLAALPPKALGHIKQLVRSTADYSLEEGLARERTLFMDLMVSKDGLERMQTIVDGGDIRDAP